MRPGKVPFVRRFTAAVSAFAVLVGVAVTAVADSPGSAPAFKLATATSVTGAAAPGGGTAKTLVLYDSTGPYAWLGEVYGQQTANLVSHFGGWTAHPVSRYVAGELAGYTATVYIGSTYDEPLPAAFLDDVTATTKPVLWMYDNIWQLTRHDATFAATHGFTAGQFDYSAVAEVRYKGTSLTRDTVNAAGLLETTVTDAAKASVLATAVRPDGTTLPWAVRGRNLTYVTEIPYSYVTHDDRYLAFADLLFGLLAPATPARHRALVRIEDVGPSADPTDLRAVADYLYSKHVPFSVAVYPRYRDPNGADTGGTPQDFTLAQRPSVVSALRYMQQRGGTLLMHGYTHQYESAANPYNAVSGDDFEFYAAHVDAGDNVVYDGPVAKDSGTWAGSRVSSSAAAFSKVGLTVPAIFEFPHYAGSVVDYRTIGSRFHTRYDRGLYFPGLFSGGTVDYPHLCGQFFPYGVRDVYGTAVVPENLGNVILEGFNNHPNRMPADIVASARRNLVVRDGVASFFYHPFLGTGYLKATVEGITSLGYTFVSPNGFAG